jgi:hypothetical protein
VLPLFEQPWPDGEYRLFQLGFVVADLVPAAARWAAVFGIGPFHVLPPTPAEYVCGDTTATIDLQVAVAQAGPVQIELIQQRCDTPSIFRDHVAGGRVGALHQLCTVTADFDAKIAGFQALGYEVATMLDRPGLRVAYVGTVDDFGFYTEVVEAPPDLLPNLAAIARTCADWDGVTDPVRLLTRTGYRVP